MKVWTGSSEDYLFSLIRWLSTSKEKLKAKAKATACQGDCFIAEMKVIARQNMLVITVRAFFSEKYFFILDEFNKVLMLANIK